MKFDLCNGDFNEQTNTYNFYGLNRTRRGTKGEFSDMLNMGTIEYPCACPRTERKLICTLEESIDCVTFIPADIVVNGFTGISDGYFYFNGSVKSGSYVLSSDYSWEICLYNNTYIINGFYDNKGSYKSVMYTYNISSDVFSAADSGKIMENLIVASGNDSNGSYLATFRYGFDAVYNYEVQVGDVTIKNSDFFVAYGDERIIEPPNIFSRFFSGSSQSGIVLGDEVSISGFPAKSENVGQIWTYNGINGEVVKQEKQDFSYNNTVDLDNYTDKDDVDEYTITNAYVKDFKVKELSIEGKTVYVHYVYFDLFNKNGVRQKFDDMITDTASFYCSGVRINRIKRIFNHIAVHNNRLFGTIPSGISVYASSSDQLFDFTSSSIDKMFSARINSDVYGKFTAIIPFDSKLLVFKSDSIMIIYGDSPSNYSVSYIYNIGCIDCRSIQVTPSGIIFLWFNGFYIYSGGTPSCISSKLNTKYISCTSGYDGNIYYACAVRLDGSRELLTYDLRYNAWHVQDDIDVSGFFRHRSDFYICDQNNIYLSDEQSCNDVEWSFTSVLCHDNTLDKKSINEMWVRAELDEGSFFMIHTSIDGEEFIAHSVFNSPGLHVFRCPIRALSGDTYKYKISGRGKVVFYEIELHKSENGRTYKDSSVSKQLISKKHSIFPTY